MARPYQPSLLRLLHIPTALLVTGLWLTGFVILGVYDGRWFRLPAAFGSVDWIDVHGTLGVPLVLLATLFVPYALSVGRARLKKAANLVPLLALVLSVGSGLLMQENLVRDGVTGGLAYGLHLTGWAVRGGGGGGGPRGGGGGGGGGGPWRSRCSGRICGRGIGRATGPPSCGAISAGAEAHGRPLPQAGPPTAGSVVLLLLQQ